MGSLRSPILRCLTPGVVMVTTWLHLIERSVLAADQIDSMAVKLDNNIWLLRADTKM